MRLVEGLGKGGHEALRDGLQALGHLADRGIDERLRALINIANRLAHRIALARLLHLVALVLEVVVERLALCVEAGEAARQRERVAGLKVVEPVNRRLAVVERLDERVGRVDHGLLVVAVVLLHGRVEGVDGAVDGVNDLFVRRGVALGNGGRGERGEAEAEDGGVFHDELIDLLLC